MRYAGTDGRAVHGELFAGDQAIWLHPSGDSYRSPRELGGVSSMVVAAAIETVALAATVVGLGAEVAAGVAVDGPVTADAVGDTEAVSRSRTQL